MVGLRYSPWYVYGLFQHGALHVLHEEKGPSYNMEGIAKDSDKSSSG